MRELRIVKRVDRASTALMAALRTNEVIKKAVLTLRKAGKTQLEYLKITIEHGRVDVARRSRPATAAAARQLVERVSFSFNKIAVEYMPQGKDGQLGGGMLFQTNSARRADLSHGECEGDTMAYASRRRSSA